ncbi:DUF983 domain-containing protein [Jiella sp. MQZ9-1]|uniref:DUF983 domain-containing protein n=1 Tax=Jiella flava TaxID=2816857 RepID=A0A939FXY4_9HYPH|nr:DUF983 domain-containing protein [Jiella flava]MBO0663522.1 DUF983 domain-containing protein [Jiella flava]MCD2472097.1 DUF983 domain-containing protein [Jiella flava]
MAEDSALHAKADPVRAATRGRCPRCGEGRLFKGFLSLEQRCAHCGLDYDFADAGDGPAVFVILIIGFIVCGLALWLEVTVSPPLWVHFILWVPLTLILCLPLLRILKGTMIGLQYRNRAAEGRLDEPGEEGR